MIDAVNATLIWIAKPMTDSVQVTYRVFPYKFNAVSQHLNYDSVRNNFLLEKAYKYKYNKQNSNAIFDFGDINYNGSIGRGISFGNARMQCLTAV